MQSNWIDEKDNFKFMKLQPGYQRIARDILLNISNIKDNQKMKFRQLIEHPKRKNFL